LDDAHHPCGVLTLGADNAPQTMEAAKRNWNWRIYVGFLVVLAGLFSYPLLLIDYPLFRDFPWLNLLLFAAGLALLGVGLVRACRKPEQYRGRVVGPVVTLLSLAGVFMFCYGLLVIARQLPPSPGAPRVGQKAPDFTLPDHDGKPVALADLLSGSRATLLIFYRGYW
jgi:ABC-type transport system involved in cytochrome c biogenesis permease subunit